jgi:hypothetical protein
MQRLVEAADSQPMIGRLATQKERKLKSLLFLPHSERGYAALALSTAVCRTDISTVRTVLLGGGLENRHLGFGPVAIVRSTAEI